MKRNPHKKSIIVSSDFIFVFFVLIIIFLSAKCTNGTNINLRKKIKPKVVESEPVILTLSSDDEDEHIKKSPSAEQLTQKLAETAVTLSAIRKEPTISDIQQNNTPDTSMEDVKGT